MRRVRLIFTSLATAVVLVMVATAGSASAGGSVSVDQQEAWIQWAFGDAPALLLDETACGEMVGDTFFMTVKGGAGTRRIDCEIAEGTPLLATPGGAIVWMPSDGTTDSELYQSLLGYLSPIVFESVRVKVDGVVLPRGPLTISDAYDMPLEPGNLISTVDPAVTGDSVRIMEGFWFNSIPGLDAGVHKIVTSDRFKGDHAKTRTVFTFTVTPSAS